MLGICGEGETSILVDRGEKLYERLFTNYFIKTGVAETKFWKMTVLKMLNCIEYCEKRAGGVGNQNFGMGEIRFICIEIFMIIS